MTSKALSSVGIIPDGNRRYAKKYNLSLPQAYARGVEKARQAVEWLDDYPSIKNVTFYTLSMENFRRSQTELNVLLGLFKGQIENALKTDFFKDNDISPRFIGRLDLMPAPILSLMKRAEEDNSDLSRNLNVAIAYTGREEIVSAAKRLAEDHKQGLVDLDKVNEENFLKYLYLDDSPDLVFRTGDVSRLSGFLTYQSAYSEFYFAKKLWPEVEKEDFAQAVDFYTGVQRNFGK